MLIFNGKNLFIRSVLVFYLSFILLSSISFFDTIHAQSPTSSITGDIESQIQNLIGNSMNKIIEDTINQVQQGINGTTGQNLESLTKSSPNSNTFSGLGESIIPNNLNNLYPRLNEEKEPTMSLLTNFSKTPHNSELENRKNNNSKIGTLDPSTIGIDTLSSKSSNLKNMFPSLFN